MNCRVFIVVGLLYFIAPQLAEALDHQVKPGESPQRAIDRAAAGDRVVLLPGLHEHTLERHRAIIYIDKPIELVIEAGATLQLAKGVCKKEAVGEITTDQDAGKKLDDFEIGGAFTGDDASKQGEELYGATVYTIVIDKEGVGDQPDTFAWGDGKLFDTPHRQVPITGDWQELSHGVKVRFKNKTVITRAVCGSSAMTVQKLTAFALVMVVKPTISRTFGSQEKARLILIARTMHCRAVW